MNPQQAQAQTGRYKLIEQAVADGLGYMFGNPGTVEQGFLDATTDFSDRLMYIFALQESVAVGIADGFARARSGLAAAGRLGDRPSAAFVQLHTGVGLGNSVGMLYQAMRGGSPLVVVAGDAGLRYDALEGQMSADLVGMARPVTKWARRITDPGNVLKEFREAVKIACTPPCGPTFLALPADVLDRPCPEAVVPTLIPSTRVAPESGLVERMAEILATAENPLVVLGDGVSDSGAAAALGALAERIGAEVWGANSAHVNVAFDHPLFGGLLGHMFGESSRKVIAAADVVFVCGTYLFPEVYPLLDGVFNEGAKVIHVDLDACQIAKNFPVTLAAVADPRETTWAVIRAVERRFTEKPDLRRTADDRLARRSQLIADRRRADQARDAASRCQVPPTLARFTEELAARCPPEDLVVFDEALTNSPDLCRYLKPPAGQFFQTRGGSLGVGIPGAIGAKLALPDKTVWGFTGDGGSLYTIQALWTAAHHRVGAKFVVSNNHGYLLLKLNILQYWEDQIHLRKGSRGTYPSSFDIGNPPIEFVTIAKGFGVGAERVDDPDRIGAAIDNALKHEGPYLIDLDLGPDAPSADAVNLAKLAGREHPVCGQ